MSNRKHSLFGKGYYIALILCALVIGITGYVYYRNTNQELTVQETPAEVTVSQFEKPEDIPAVATEPVLRATEPAATDPATDYTLKTAAPLEGETVMGYAVETLSYNATTRDWRTHHGVDIAAEEGSAVCAAADGTVYTVYEDDSLGTTVIIRHNGGYVTTYAGLQKELTVAVGEKVTLGQQIGCVGTTAMVETVLGPHLHFGVTFRDNDMDPAEFLALGQ